MQPLDFKLNPEILRLLEEMKHYLTAYEKAYVECIAAAFYPVNPIEPEQQFAYDMIRSMLIQMAHVLVVVGPAYTPVSSKLHGEAMRTLRELALTCNSMFVFSKEAI